MNGSKYFEIGGAEESFGRPLNAESMLEDEEELRWATIESFVARGMVILAEYIKFTGNFTSISSQCLQKLPASNNKFTYQGRGSSLSRQEWNKILIGVDAEFEVAERDQKKNRRKKMQKKNEATKDDFGSLFGDGITGTCLKLNKYPGGLMHMELVEAANQLTNYMGTAYILSNLAALLADTYISRFKTVVFVGSLEFLHCNIFDPASLCEKIDGANAALLFVGLYMVAVGRASVKAGRDEKDPKEARQMSSFFNGLLLAVCVGGAISLTLIVWIQDNRGWDWGFGISSISLFLAASVFASGLPIYRIQVIQGNSPIIEIIQVYVAAIHNRHLHLPQDPIDLYEIENDKEAAVEAEFLPHRDIFMFSPNLELICT
ncbi:protein NRT1/ PTR FAMILY 6.3-like [Carya illinoinensis]|uniref:protein NRT1/ PTR FAMILY 6.3-like n=1 Tax=Carya illinoinensis TaxID=32201 RepID=UPI001C724569|nr:protein NRT1/ PTR FAMILY 6.3-like [Carya illinoinensis]